MKNPWSFDSSSIPCAKPEVSAWICGYAAGSDERLTGNAKFSGLLNPTPVSSIRTFFDGDELKALSYKNVVPTAKGSLEKEISFYEDGYAAALFVKLSVTDKNAHGTVIDRFSAAAAKLGINEPEKTMEKALSPESSEMADISEYLRSVLVSSPSVLIGKKTIASADIRAGTAILKIKLDLPELGEDSSPFSAEVSEFLKKERASLKRAGLAVKTIERKSLIYSLADDFSEKTALASEDAYKTLALKLLLSGDVAGSLLVETAFGISSGIAAEKARASGISLSDTYEKLKNDADFLKISEISGKTKEAVMALTVGYDEKIFRDAAFR